VRQTAIAAIDAMAMQSGLEPMMPFLAAALLADGQPLLRKVRAARAAPESDERRTLLTLIVGDQRRGVTLATGPLDVAGGQVCL